MVNHRRFDFDWDRCYFQYEFLLQVPKLLWRKRICCHQPMIKPRMDYQFIKIKYQKTLHWGQSDPGTKRRKSTDSCSSSDETTLLLFVLWAIYRLFCYRWWKRIWIWIWIIFSGKKLILDSFYYVKGNLIIKLIKK